ncbi:GntR family transcriptional regulator [Devosia algicola]|uniref:GntR family transcriptional regulator n=1 Tax=Devosia algicola TaxID=3026418 RepID=A0ABY7YLX1_9HYPH|nr:GntR family transcriptional regulator [Devosia algicola]WDR02173.1 GntR family transcriptional regulator [Devosia algicola]
MSATGTESLAESAYRLIEEEIVMLRLAPGAMTTEQRMCEHLGLGRTPVREALLRLAGGFLVTIMNRRGVYIRPIEVEYALMTVDVRRSVERLLVQRATRYADDFERRRFYAMADRIEETANKADIIGFMRADDELNRLVGKAARHDVAARTVAPLHCVNRRLGYLYAGDEGKGLSYTGKEHAHMMRAIADGDQAASERALDNLLDATVTIAHAIGELSEERALS